MKIIYADDTTHTLQEVCDHLAIDGHEAVALETFNLLNFEDRLLTMLREGFTPDIIIIGGHSMLRDRAGDSLLDLDVFCFTTWLKDHALPQSCRLILFSRDGGLRENARLHPEWGLDHIISKDNPSYLAQLLQAVQPVLN